MRQTHSNAIILTKL